MFARRSTMCAACCFAGLVAALWILAACQTVPSKLPTSVPIPTPVPVATWIAQGIPADTRISYHVENGLADWIADTRIMADGSATFEGGGRYERRELRAGRLSTETLKLVILAFEEQGFFALGVERDGCVYDVTRPRAPLTPYSQRWRTDDDYVSISITINGISNGLSYYAGCESSGDNGAWARLNVLRGVLAGVVQDLPYATRTATPAPSLISTSMPTETPTR